MSTANLKSTIKLFKAHSDNKCVKAVSGILEYAKAEKACLRPYETLLKEERNTVRRMIGKAGKESTYSAILRK